FTSSFFSVPAPTELYTLSLHDALPISLPLFGADRSHSLFNGFRYGQFGTAPNADSEFLAQFGGHFSGDHLALFRHTKDRTLFVTEPPRFGVQLFSELATGVAPTGDNPKNFVPDGVEAFFNGTEVGRSRAVGSGAIGVRQFQHRTDQCACAG